MRRSVSSKHCWPVKKSSTEAENTFLWAIIGLAVLVRLVAAFYLGDKIASQPGIYDQVSYHELARRWLGGFGFSFGTPWWPSTAANAPTAHWSYLYTLYLAAVYALLGPHPLAARLIQAVVAGLLHPWLTWRVGRRVLGAPVGLAAAALCAGYAYFIYYAAALVTETFYILAVLWSLDAAMRLACGLGRSGRARLGLELGLALGVAVLLRQVLLLFLPFLFAWLAWHALAANRLRPALTATLLASTVMALLISPWTLRNYRAFGRFVLLNTNAGFAFFWANHPIHTTRFIPILSEEQPSYQSLIPPELRRLDEAALDRALLRIGLGFVAQDPLRYALLSLSRVGEYFKFWPSPQSGMLSNVARVASFGLCLPLMLFGLALSVVRAPSNAATGPPLVSLLWLFVAVYSAIHLLSWSLIRYRLPVDAVLVIFAGLAVIELGHRFLRNSHALAPTS